MFDSIYSYSVTPVQFLMMAATAIVCGFLYSWLMSFSIRSQKRFFVLSLPSSTAT